MAKLALIVVDADAIVAQAFPGDANHNLAVATSELINSLKAQILYPITAVLEAVTVLQGRLNSGAVAYGIAEIFMSPGVNVVGVDKEILKKAKQYFSATASKKNTIFDCIVAAVAVENKADAIFSFDKFYVKKGFKLAQDLMK